MHDELEHTTPRVEPESRFANGPWLEALLALAVAGFLSISAASSVWISRANFPDPFCFSRGMLWFALDPGGLYVEDSATFFSTKRVEHDAHPGVTLSALAGGVMRAGYVLGRTLPGADRPYLVHVVEHHRLYFGLVSFLCGCLWVVCAFLVGGISRLLFADRHLAISSSVLFLGAVPVLLFSNRFSPEPVMLATGLAGMYLSIRALQEGARRWDWTLMGLAVTFSLWAKPLMAPVALSCLVAAFRSADRGSPASPTKLRILLRALEGLLPFLVVSAAFLAKMPESHKMFFSSMRSRPVTDYVSFFRRADQAPLAGHHALLAALAAFGLLSLLLRWRHVGSDSLAMVLVVGFLMMVMVLPSPRWHYFFGFYWILLLVVGNEATYWMRKMLGGRRESALFALVASLAVLDGWLYSGLYATFRHYQLHYKERGDAIGRDPVVAQAIWERRPGDSDLSEIWSVRSQELQATLERLRRSRQE